jgi:CubicO group peptidase (beta-lactamase class C family)
MARRLLILAFLIAISTQAQTIDSAAIDRLARESMAAFQLPGMAVAIVKDDRVVYAKGFGVKEIGGTTPVTADTLFQIASTSKAFTTTAMAMLVDEKKMRWDDRVSQHVDYFRLSDPCADSLVTLRDIVSHRSGVSRHDELWDYTTWPREDIIRRIGSAKLTRPIRAAYQYNNIMFMTAGEAVSAASGMPWETFVKTRLFEPLGMRNTVVSEEDWVRADHASSHRYDWDTRTVSVHKTNPYDSLGPAGTIKSSARDLAQWVRFHLADGTIDGKRLVSPEALSETKKPQVVLSTDRDDYPETNISTYGLGWRVQDYRGELLVWHSGSLNFFRAQVALLPKARAGVVLLTNMNRGYGIIALRNGLLDALIGEGTRDWNAYFLAHEEKLEANAKKSKAEKDAKRVKDTKPSRSLDAYAGTYSGPAYGDGRVDLVDGQLVLTWHRLRLPLTHYHFDTFTATNKVEEIDEQVTFALGADGQVKSLSVFGEEFFRSAAAKPPL